MAIVIKKLSKKTVFSIFLIGGIFWAFILRMFLGAGYINLSRFNSRSSNPIGSEDSSLLINSAKADGPIVTCSYCGSSGGGE